MSNSIIEIKNISKKYKITHRQGGYVALRDVLAGILKNPFGFLKIKTRQIAGLEMKEEFWALKNINLEINKGEVVGIIGSNGAGKSTLLKILSQITPPTTGEITMNGKVGSLLEVGTGFHPELTGRENIFLNGAILGIPKKEIVEKFDDIVEFSGIGKFIDTPVKRYSSGMYVRLAFAVAAHMEPDILIIDEVLAVGDAEFQKKCLGKMDEITKEEGRTILFVSHNMTAIQSLCTKTVLLENGKIKMIGETKKVIEKYLENKSSLVKIPLKNRLDRKGKGKIKFTDIKIENKNIKSGDNVKIFLKYESSLEEEIRNGRIFITIYDDKDIPVLRADTFVTNKTFEKIPPSGEIICGIDSLNLINGIYHLNIALMEDKEWQDIVSNSINFEIENNNEKYNYKNDPEKNFNVITTSYKFEAK